MAWEGHSARPRRIRASGFCFLLLWLGLLAIAPTGMMNDPGTFWHTVVGERMLESGRIIRTDPFSFTCAGQPWIAQQWLAEIGMALLHRLAGLDALVLAASVLLAATYAFVFGRFLCAGVPWLAAAVLMLLTLAAGSCHFLPRPHLATIALTAVTFALLNDVDAGRRRPQWLLALPPIFVLWTNLHGGALGGIATAFITMLGWLLLSGKLTRPAGFHTASPPVEPSAVPRPISPPAASRRFVGLIAISCGLSLAAVLVNPYGPALPRVWVSLMNSPVLPRLMVEHARLSLTSPEGVMTLALAAVYLFMLAVTYRQRCRVTWLVPLLWLVLALSRVRHAPLFAIVAAIAVADMLHYWLRGPIRVSSAVRGHPLGGQAIPVAAVGIVLFLQMSGVPCPIIGAGWIRPSPQRWPVAAVAALQKRLPANGPPTRIFNDLALGGYLIYTSPDVRVFIDDRCELYRDDGLQQYERLLQHPQEIDALAAYDRVDYSLTRSGSRFDRHFSGSPAWQVVHRDPTATLYARVPQLARR